MSEKCRKISFDYLVSQNKTRSGIWLVAVITIAIAPWFVAAHTVNNQEDSGLLAEVKQLRAQLSQKLPSQSVVNGNIQITYDEKLEGIVFKGSEAYWFEMPSGLFVIIGEKNGRPDIRFKPKNNSTRSWEPWKNH